MNLSLTHLQVIFQFVWRWLQLNLFLGRGIPLTRCSLQLSTPSLLPMIPEWLHHTSCGEGSCQTPAVLLSHGSAAPFASMNSSVSFHIPTALDAVRELPCINIFSLVAHWKQDYEIKGTELLYVWPALPILSPFAIKRHWESCPEAN